MKTSAQVTAWYSHLESDIASSLTSKPLGPYYLGLRYSNSRLNARSAGMHDFSINHPPTLNTYKMSHEDRIKKALAELESCLKPNYSELARKY
jgi:hypothetical protein